MAVSNLPAFAQGPQARTVTGTLALGAIGGGAPTGTVTLMSAGPLGSYITKITAIPMGTVAASSIVLFESTSPAGSTLMYPVDSELMPAYTQATTTALPETNFSNISPANPKRVGPSMYISIGCEVAQAAGIAYHIEWQDM